MPIASQLISSRSARSNLPYRDFNFRTESRELPKMGININDHVVNKMHKKINEFAMDNALSLQQPITTPSITTPLQFAQFWMPGLVEVATAYRGIDDFVGLDIMGNWEQEQVVQGIKELLGTPQLYSDETNVPYASLNVNWIFRTIVRFELGMRVGRLAEARNALAYIELASDTRNSIELNLEILRNNVGFLGFNAGDNQTYGFLNDPSLPGYMTVPEGLSTSTQWTQKTTLEIINDIQLAISTLRTQSKNVVDPQRLDLTLAVSTNRVDRLSTPTELGYTILEWLKLNYPRIRVVNAAELDVANGGANVFYLYADSIPDGGSDNGKVWVQAVQTKFLNLGVAVYEKYYSEDYSNATAGLMLKRPYAVVRFTGI